MTSLAQIKQWSDRFHFSEGELEVILRCHSVLSSKKKTTSGGGSFLSILVHSVPYVFFFLPQDELEVRTVMVGLVYYSFPLCFFFYYLFIHSSMIGACS